MGIINFPGSYEARESDEFYRGFWDGLGEGYRLAEQEGRRISLIGVILGAFSGALVATGGAILITFLAH